MGSLAWRFDEREYNYVKEVLDSGFASGTTGNMNSRLEHAFSKKFGLNYAVTFNSGTTTLHAALVALGVGYDDEVIIPALTVAMCMNAVLYCNAIPVFADIDPDTFLMDPKDLRKKITKKTKAIMPVHLYGQVCDMTEIMKIAEEFGLKVVEDCAQCYLGTHKGKIGGTFGDVGSWSFENSKHLTTGDGGIIACNNENIAEKIRKLNTCGFRNATAKSGKVRIDKDIFQNPSYKRHDTFAFMYRMPEVAAALGLAQIEKLDWFVEKRKKMAVLYKQVIENTKCSWLKPQNTPTGDINSYYTFAARFVNNDIKWEDLRKKHVEYGGDGIYAAWALTYKEDSIPDIKRFLKSIKLDNRINTNDGLCPNAELVQPQLMQFTTNQKDDAEMHLQADALFKAIKYFS
ncbi:MAG: DegT/DnrJ/EryC1/StrS family aminotransferase [Candidatus Omnitrophica bacterium]|nr:DegT/DnrJ/EryC1/StrS family aminotransferase [Candidatus Omnitrophota bacterium]